MKRWRRTWKHLIFIWTQEVPSKMFSFIIQIFDRKGTYEGLNSRRRIKSKTKLTHPRWSTRICRFIPTEDVSTLPQLGHRHLYTPLNELWGREQDGHQVRQQQKTSIQRSVYVLLAFWHWARLPGPAPCAGLRRGCCPPRGQMAKERGSRCRGPSSSSRCCRYLRARRRHTPCRPVKRSQLGKNNEVSLL